MSDVSTAPTASLVVLDAPRVIDLLGRLDERALIDLCDSAKESPERVHQMASGALSPSDEVVQALSVLYGVPLERLGARRTCLRLDADRLVVPGVRSLETAATPEAVLAEYAALVTWMRGASSSEEIVWRTDDIEVLARAFEWTPDAVQSALITQAAAPDLARRSARWRGRRLIPAAFALVLGATLVGAILIVADDPTPARPPATAVDPSPTVGLIPPVSVERTDAGADAGVEVGLIPPIAVEQPDVTAAPVVEAALIDPVSVENADT